MNLSIIPTVKSVVTDGNEVSFFDFAPAMSLQAHCRTEDILSDFAFELKGNKLIKAEIDESLEKEEYSVAVSENEIVIKGSCDAGVHYGFCTLVQLAALNDGAIPTGVINDKPDMSFRISRIRSVFLSVPTSVNIPTPFPLPNGKRSVSMLSVSAFLFVPL